MPTYTDFNGPYGQQSTYPIPAGAIEIAAGANIQSVINANPVGSTYAFAGSTYRMQTFTPKTGDTYIGRVGTILNGSQVLTGWTQSGSNFFVAGQSETIGGGECQVGFNRCTYQNDVYYDDVPLVQAESLGALTSGKFFFDAGTGRIYIRDNPNGHTVEIGVTTVAVNGNASGVTLLNLQIEKYANPAQTGAVLGGANWTVQACTIRLCHGIGLGMADGRQVFNCALNTNGQMGIGGSSTGALVQNNEIAFNNYAHFNPGWEAGGSKFTFSNNLTLRGNYCHDNAGPGLWLDIDNINYLIEANRCIGNFSPNGTPAPGIMSEISFGGIIRDNLSTDNGAGFSDYLWSAGILISSSGGAGIEIYRNVLSNNQHGISLIQTNRTADGPNYFLQNINVHDNQVTMQQGLNGAADDSGNTAIFTSRNITFQNNTYFLAPGNHFAWMNSDRSQAEWVGFGLDVTGQFFPLSQTITVNAGGNLQAALDTANPGDTILLQASALFTGNYVWSQANLSVPVTLMSAGTLPAPGTRVTPTTAANFAKIQASAGGSPALRMAMGSAGLTVIGIEFLPNPGGFNDIIGIGDGSSAQHLFSQVPQNFVIDRCYIHGSPTTGQKRGISLQSGNTTIKNCYISDIFASGQDSQAIGGWNGSGPYLIDNNYLEAASENFLLGGNDVFVPNQLPSDVTFTNNWVTKKQAWRGQGYNVKNLLELKIGQRILIDSNLFEYNWAEAQPGYAIVFTVRNESGATPWATIANVTFSRNRVRHVASVFNILGLDDRPGITSVLMTNLLMQDTQAYDVDKAAWGGSGHLAQIQKGDRITLNHNTGILDQTGQDVSIYLVGANALTNFVLTNNIFPCSPVPNLAIFGDQGQAAGIPTLQTAAPGYVCARNVIYGPNGILSNYPPDAFYPTIDGVGFVDRFNDDYRLATGSPYIGAALDGTDIGARFGNAPPVNPPTPPAIPNTPAPANGASGVSLAAVLSWLSAGAQSYRVAFGTTNPPPVVVPSQAGNSYDPPGNLANLTTYFWQIQATNAGGNSLGPIWSFTTVAPPPPGTPSTPSPANNATNVAITSAVSWAPTSGATSYDVRFGTTNPPPLVSSGQTGTTYQPPAALGFSTTYFWQVTANNAGGSTSGPVWRFTTAAQPTPPPTAPANPVPADGALDRPITQQLAWGGATGATTYTVAFGTVNPPPTVATVSTPAYNPGTLVNGTVYFWKITANNSAGSTAGPVWSFTTVSLPAPPTTPSTPNPTNGAINVDVTSNVSWAVSAGATSYDVAFGTVNPPPTVSTSQTATSYDPPGNLAFSTVYFWKVTAKNAGGNTAGPVWSFTTAPPPVVPNPPTAPTTPTPANGATNQALTTQLQWAGDTGATTYTVKFGTSSPPPTVAGGVTSRTYNPGTLAYGTTYFWQIVANNPDGSTASAIWSFSTIPAPPPPSAPTNPSPADLATNVAITTGLAWGASSGATSYAVKFGTVNPPPQVVASQTGTTYQPVGSLNFSTTYFWQIVATNAGGSTSGPVWRFTTADPPPPAPTAPTTPTPSNSATNVPITQQLAWSGDTGATSFSVRFGATPTPPVVAGGVTAHTYNPGTLLNNTQYFWQIVANNSSGTAASPVWSFTTIAIPPPDTPSGPSPANGALNVNVNQDLSWALTNGAQSYAVQFGTTNPPPTVASGLTIPAYPLQTLAFSTTYFWRVTATGPGGSTQGPIWSFTTEASPPPPPPPPPPGTATNPIPADGATNVSRSIRPSWTAAPLATSYRVNFGAANPPPFLRTTTSLNFNPPGNLRNGTTYYWQITAVNANGQTPGPIWRFTVGNLSPPGTPTGPNPANGATGIALNTSLTWGGASGATSYNVAFGTTNPPPAVATGVTGTTFTPATPLAYGTTYFWRITAVNAAGSTQGSVWSFTTRAAPNPPTAPSTPSPADGATAVSITPSLSWGGGSGASGFTIAFGTVNPPPSVTTSLTASYSPGTLAYSTTYYWRIGATNADGTTLGPVWSFTTVAAPAPPSTPGSPVPADTATNIAITSGVSWGASTGATGYDVAFGSTNPPPTVSSNQPGTSYAPLDVLAYFTVYYWKITARGLGGNTAGPVWSFRTIPEPVIPHPPTAPATPSPADGATGQALNTTLSWGGGVGADTFAVAFGTVSPPPLVQGGVLTPAHDPGALDYGTTYYWQITANNSDGATVGPIWSFTTIAPPTPPGVPDTPSPANLATDVAIAVVLSWAAALDADSYTVAFGALPTPSVVSTGQAGLTYNPGILDYATTYFWQVTAVNAGGETASLLWSFTTQNAPPPAPPSTPATPSPVDGATGVSRTPTLDWADTAGADTYTIAFGTSNPPSNIAGGLTESTYTPAGPLDYGTTYYWRVTAVNEGGPTVGPVWSFTTLAAPPAPTAVSNPSPANSATGVAITTPLSWTVGANTDTMDLAFGTVNPPPTVQLGLTVGAYTSPGNLLNSTTYFWQVTSHNAFGDTVGPLWSFTTEAAPPPDPPDTPSSPSPADGAINVAIAALLSWVADNSVNYDVYFGTTNPPPLLQAGVLTASFDPPITVYGQTYYWQIVANNNSGSTPGPVWSFTAVAAPTGTCQILTADGASIVTSDGAIVVIACEVTENTIRVTQLPLIAAYDYAILQPILTTGSWATPGKSCTNE